jgi:hypothetical protein
MGGVGSVRQAGAVEGYPLNFTPRVRVKTGVGTVREFILKKTLAAWGGFATFHVPLQKSRGRNAANRREAGGEK